MIIICNVPLLLLNVHCYFSLFLSLVALKIHVSAATKLVLDIFKTFRLELRGEVELKVKLPRIWLNEERLILLYYFLK